MREVVIDTETTGLSYKSGDRIIEVGCVELINHVATNNSLQFYCKVDKEISESAQIDSIKKANNIIASISSLKIFLMSGLKILIATSLIVPLSFICALCT